MTQTKESPEFPARFISVVCDQLATLKAKPRPRTEPAQQPVIAGFDDDLPDWG
ncbi:MAG: hypothetical protein LM522_15335 [Candidatus Contendobacter sp.]|nr:hypothetical protein [Candidatus Contendobacter sp.]